MVPACSLIYKIEWFGAKCEGLEILEDNEAVWIAVHGKADAEDSGGSG